MKSQLSIAAMLLISGCSTPEQRQHTEIMDAIENKVQIPSEAGPIIKFARTYKYASATRIVAFYFVPDDRADESFCKTDKEGGPTNGQILLGCLPPDGMKAGERRWLNDNAFLPDVSDGGCNYIDVEYDLLSKSVTYAKCHGEA